MRALLLALRVLIFSFASFNLLSLTYACLLILIGSKRKNLKKSSDPSKQDLPSLSILIAARKESHILPYTLKILFDRLEYPKDRVEVVIAVDEDDMETLSACKGLEQVRTVIVPGHLGKPNALNVGFKATRGDLIMIMDADSVIERGTPLNMLSLMEERDVAGVAAIPHPLNISEGLLPLLFSLEVRLWERLTSAKDSLNLLIQAPGCLSLLRRSWIEIVGGWCDCIAEDNELSAKIFCKGGRIRLSNAKVGVEAPTRLGTLIRQRFRWYRGTLDALRFRLRDALRLHPLRCADLLLSFSSPLALASLIPMLLYASIFQGIILYLLMAFMLAQLILASFRPRDLSKRERAKVLVAVIPYILLNSLIALASSLSVLIPLKPSWNRTEKTGKVIRSLIERETGELKDERTSLGLYQRALI